MKKSFRKAITKITAPLPFSVNQARHYHKGPYPRKEIKQSHSTHTFSSYSRKHGSQKILPESPSTLAGTHVLPNFCSSVINLESRAPAFPVNLRFNRPPLESNPSSSVGRAVRLPSKIRNGSPRIILLPDLVGEGITNYGAPQAIRGGRRALV